MERQKRPGWEPLLHGEVRADAWDTITAIARDLADVASGARDLPEIRGDADRDATLGGGDAGLALFFHYLASSSTDFPEAPRLRDACIARAVEALSVRSMGPSLFSGIVGICWALNHIVSASAQDRRSRDDQKDPLAQIDSVLCRYTANRSDNLDIIDGLTGTGIYLLARRQRPVAREAVANIVRFLDRSAERDGRNVCWRVPAESLDAGDRDLFPQGRYDLGVAHGVPGIIAFLARAQAAGVAPELAGRLLDGAVQWLLAQAPAESASPRFPYWVAPVGPSPMTRIAWCYGDLGLASSLLATAVLARRADWRQYAVDLVRHISDRSLNETAIIDAGLCHGTSGAGHLLNRIFHLSGDRECRDAARLWFARTLRLRNAGSGNGGYLSLIKDANMQDLWIADPGFLSGASGIGLALLAAVTEVEPAWDSILLASCPGLRTGAALTES